MLQADVLRRIHPRLRNADLALTIPGGEDEILALSRPLSGDLLLTYSFDDGGSHETITLSRMKALGVSLDQVMTRSLHNISRMTAEVEVQRRGPAFQVTLPQGLSPTIYLFDDFWRGIRAQLGSPPLVAFAHRNFVAFTAVSDPAGRDFLRFAIRERPDDEGALSRYLYTWDEDWASELEPGSDQLRTREVTVADLFRRLATDGRAKLPAPLGCPHCGADIVIDEERVASSAAGALTDLLPREYEPFRRSCRAFPASAPGRFVVEIRCPACKSALAIGGEESGGKAFRPVRAWTLA